MSNRPSDCNGQSSSLIGFPFTSLAVEAGPVDDFAHTTVDPAPCQQGTATATFPQRSSSSYSGTSSDVLSEALSRSPLPFLHIAIAGSQRMDGHTRQWCTDVLPQSLDRPTADGSIGHHRVLGLSEVTLAGTKSDSFPDHPMIMATSGRAAGAATCSQSSDLGSDTPCVNDGSSNLSDPHIVNCKRDSFCSDCSSYTTQKKRVGFFKGFFSWAEPPQPNSTVVYKAVPCQPRKPREPTAGSENSLRSDTLSCGFQKSKGLLPFEESEKPDCVENATDSTTRASSCAVDVLVSQKSRTFSDLTDSDESTGVSNDSIRGSSVFHVALSGDSRTVLSGTYVQSQGIGEGAKMHTMLTILRKACGIPYSYVHKEVSVRLKHTPDRRFFYFRFCLVILLISVLFVLNVLLQCDLYSVSSVGRIYDALHVMTEDVNGWLLSHPQGYSALQFLASFCMDMLFLVVWIQWLFIGDSLRLPIAYALLYGCRAIVRGLCILPYPEHYLWNAPTFVGLSIPSLTVPYQQSDDFFFSGHVGCGVLAIMEHLAHRCWSCVIFSTLVTCFQVFTMTVTRGHYTIDMVTGAVVASWVHMLAQKACLYIDEWKSHRKLPRGRTELKTTFKRIWDEEDV